MEHKGILEIAQELGVPKNQVPKKWPKRLYDEAWIIDLTKPTPALTIIPEYVRPGDNPLGGSDWANPPEKSPLPAPVLNPAIQTACATNKSINDLVEKITLTDPQTLQDIRSEIEAGH